MTAPVVQFFVNPRPSWLARRRIAALRRAFEDAGATVLTTESAVGQLEIDARADHLCAVGGDGTLRHVVAALHRSGRDIPISVYPTGTVNLFARECGYPRAAGPFLQRALRGSPVLKCHTGLVADLPVLTCASVGPDSYAVDRLSPRLKVWIGRAAYVAAVGRLLIDWPRPKLTLKWEGRSLSCEAVYIAKGHYFAGPWTIAPDARLTDPFLHVVALRHMRRMDFIRFAWTMLIGGSVESLEGVQAFRCTELAVDGDRNVPLQTDGDIVTQLPATISMRAAPTTFA
jgi:diacylglycerol kinase (ATP)